MHARAPKFVTCITELDGSLCTSWTARARDFDAHLVGVRLPSMSCILERIIAESDDDGHAGDVLVILSSKAFKEVLCMVSYLGRLNNRGAEQTCHEMRRDTTIVAGRCSSFRRMLVQFPRRVLETVESLCRAVTDGNRKPCPANFHGRLLLSIGSDQTTPAQQHAALPFTTNNAFRVTKK